MVQSKKYVRKKRGRRFGREGEFFAFRLSLVLEWGVSCCCCKQVGGSGCARVCVSKQAVKGEKEEKRREEKRAVRDGGSTFGPWRRKGRKR
jgi:hypothetical protein